jgi:hypothetical protein
MKKPDSAATYIPLKEAHRILENAAAIIVNNDALVYASVDELEDSEENEFLHLSWEVNGLQYSLKFAEGDNKQVKINSHTMHLLDTDAKNDEDYTEIQILESKNLTELDPHRGFDSPSEAIEYAKRQSDPFEAAKQIIMANIEFSEYGFASEVTDLLDTL